MRTNKKSCSPIMVSTVVFLLFIFSTTTALGCEGDPYIYVETSTDWITLSATQGSTDGGSDIFDPAAIYITVYDSYGNPMPSAQVRVTTNTLSGSGGHAHSSETRPTANLDFVTGIAGGRIADNDIIATTDGLGKVQVKYTPPFVKVKNKLGQEFTRVVAGTDTITVSLVAQPEINAVRTIIVGYKDFVSFENDENIELSIQDHHGYEFWCTADTSQSMKNIGKKCKEETGRKINVSAMSLQWGGLLDIDGTWNAPHAFHSHGKNVDIGVTYMSSDDKKILEKNILEDPNFNNLNKEKKKVKDKDGNYIKDKNGTYVEKEYCYHISFKK